MARKNETWGYTRIQGALKNLGHAVGRNTSKRVLKAEGIEPAPSRRQGMSWWTLIKAHLGALAAMDFFTVEAMTWVGLVRYHVLFVIDVASRRVEIAGIGRDPDGSWMKQMARNLLGAEDGILRGKRYLILDRDSLYTEAFRRLLQSAGVEPLRLPARSPNLNAFAERFVLSVRSECLSRLVPLGERHLRKALSEYVAHYHGERHHQGLGSVLIAGGPEPANTNGRVACRERLGGVLNSCYREAA